MEKMTQEEVGRQETWLGCVSELDIEAKQRLGLRLLIRDVEGLAQRYEISIDVGLFHSLRHSRMAEATPSLCRRCRSVDTRSGAESFRCPKGHERWQVEDMATNLTENRSGQERLSLYVRHNRKMSKGTSPIERCSE